MNYKIEYISVFQKKLKQLGKKYHSIRQDYARLLKELHANPYAGADLGGDARKVRMSIKSKGKGKSRGARVITYLVSAVEENIEVSLLTIYDKSERENISDKEIKSLIQALNSYISDINAL